MGNGSRVVNRAALCRDFFAQPTAVGGGALAVEIGFKRMSHRFMQENARLCRAKNDGHQSGRCLASVQQQQRFSSSLFSKPHRVIGLPQDFLPHTSPHAGGSVLKVAPVLRNAVDVHPEHWAGVAQQVSVRRGDLGMSDRIHEGHRDSYNPRVLCFGGGFCLLDELNFLGQGQVGNRLENRIVVSEFPSVETPRLLQRDGTGGGNGRSSACSAAHGSGLQHLTVGVARLLALQDTDAHSGNHGDRGAFDNALLHDDRMPEAVLEIKVRIIPAIVKGFGEYLLHHGFVHTHLTLKHRWRHVGGVGEARLIERVGECGGEGSHYG